VNDFWAREEIFNDIDAERERQDVLHPTSGDLPDGTGGSARDTWMAIAKNACERAAREGTCTFAHVLDEEASEALAETDPVKLRAELIQVAAVCVRWAEKLDRDAAKAGGR
jgi:hypothetical protein